MVLPQQLAIHRRCALREQDRLLRAAQQFLTAAQLAALDPRAQPVAHRRLDAAKSLLPYIWGVSPEQWQQVYHFEWEGVVVSSLNIEQESQPPLRYWLLGGAVALPFEAESTAFLPLPFAHDRWTVVRYNASIDSPVFRAQYRSNTSEFLHSYYVARGSLLRHFLAQAADQPTYLVVRKGWLYWALPQTGAVLAPGALAWEQRAAQTTAQLTEGYRLAQEVQKMIQHLV